MRYLTKQQVDQLLWPIKSERVSKNRDGKSHVEAYDDRAHLIRVFGFGMWDGEVLAMDQLFEQVFEQVAVVNKNEKRWVAAKPNDTGEKRWAVSVGYRAHYRLKARTPDGDLLATYSEWAAGDAVNFPINQRGDAHDFAMKTAESQAFKRCAINLGDQFGLSLYNKGSVAPLVGGTHHYPFAVEKKPAGEQDKRDADVSAHITTQLAPEVDPPDERESARITQQPRNGNGPAEEPPPPDDEPGDAFPNNDLRTRILNAKDGRELLGIKTDAVKAGVHKQMTANRDGVSVTFGALIDAEVQAKRKANT